MKLNSDFKARGITNSLSMLTLKIKSRTKCLENLNQLYIKQNIFGIIEIKLI